MSADDDKSKISWQSNKLFTPPSLSGKILAKIKIVHLKATVIFLKIRINYGIFKPFFFSNWEGNIYLSTL